MKPKFMLDTNICIYLMKHQPAQVRERFDQCYVGDVVISSITLAELEYGVACSGKSRKHNQQTLDSLLEDILGVPFGSDAARSYGPLRASNPDRNKDALDKLIAAHALSLDLALITNNEDDFKLYDGLRVENWVKAACS